MVQKSEPLNSTNEIPSVQACTVSVLLLKINSEFLFKWNFSKLLDVKTSLPESVITVADWKSLNSFDSLFVKQILILILIPPTNYYSIGGEKMSNDKKPMKVFLDLKWISGVPFSEVKRDLKKIDELRDKSYPLYVNIKCNFDDDYRMFAENRQLIKAVRKN